MCQYTYHITYHIYNIILVGSFNPSEKILVSWDYYSQYMEKNKYSKPPISYIRDPSLDVPLKAGKPTHGWPGWSSLTRNECCLYGSGVELRYPKKDQQIGTLPKENHRKIWGNMGKYTIHGGIIPLFSH